MRNARVRILAGSDAANPYTVPGWSLHEELALLVAAGLSPMEALQSATTGPVEFLGLTDSLGSVSVGRVADLVLLEGNPLLGIRNTSRIAAVVLNGRLIDSDQLRRLSLQAEQGARR